MNFDDFSYEENGRRYIKPEIGLNESNSFINSLRSMQQANNSQIRQDTYNLGTAVPSNVGGLVGGGSYFKSRLQTPQTNSLVADLKATMQAQALQEAMSNELTKAKKRYSDAYRAAKKNSNNNNNSDNPYEDLLKALTVKTDPTDAGDKQDVAFDEPGEEELPEGVVGGRKWDAGDIATSVLGNYLLSVPGVVLGPAGAVIPGAAGVYDYYNSKSGKDSWLEQVASGTFFDNLKNIGK